jgi:hypothetical protein
MSLNDENSQSRRYRMFKKRIKQLDIFEEADRKNKRIWNMVEDS